MGKAGFCVSEGISAGFCVSEGLRAIAGVTYPLVNKKYVPDAAAKAVTDGLTSKSVPSGYLSRFPYLGVPYSGYSTPS